ncbi:MAG TPA: sigma-70 family RNA polymerase sigma factor [Terriglobales bacterium]|nr:sigma-70 family RNA polymerase sigma factor [Terriglobales bacterium]
MALNVEPHIARDEAALIERIRRGERALFHELIRPYERGVYLAAYSILHNEADAEEVAQESILKALLHLGQLREEEKFKSWLLLIVVNEAKMRRRKDRQHLYESVDDPGTESEEGEFLPRQFADWREIPSESLERAEVRAAVSRALKSLPGIYREVFVLRDVEHLTVTETAQALEISEAAVKTRLHRARLQMREQLAPAFGRSWLDRVAWWRGKKPW